MSHTQALGQCRNTLRKLGLKPVPEADTAGSARIVAERQRPEPRCDRHRPLPPRSTASDPQERHRGRDAQHHPLRHPRRRSPTTPNPANGPFITTFIFRVRNVPAALYKALGRICDQRCQHDEAGKLSAQKARSRRRCSMPISTAIRRIAPFSWRSRNCRSFRLRAKILGTYPASPFGEVGGRNSSEPGQVPMPKPPE